MDIRSRVAAAVTAAVMLAAFPGEPARSAPAAKSAIARAQKKIDDAAAVMKAIRSDPETRIPPSLVRKCEAIAIFPGMVKAGFMIGGSYGTGVILARGKAGAWSAPAFFTVAGASYGLQLGAQSSDVILLFMDRSSLAAVLKGRCTVGADAAVAAGPTGKSAEANTDLLLTSGIISYSMSRGLFAGVAFKGGVITFDRAQTRAWYGTERGAEDLLAAGAVPCPEGARPLAEALERCAEE